MFRCLHQRNPVVVVEIEFDHNREAGLLWSGGCPLVVDWVPGCLLLSPKVCVFQSRKKLSRQS